jgi:hypothetical protein
MKPFTVNAYWIHYAHGPGAEDGHALAQELVNLAYDAGDKPVKLTKREHVDEVRDVAELYDGNSAVQDDDRLWFRLYPHKVIKRAKAWLAAYDKENAR